MGNVAFIDSPTRSLVRQPDILIYFYILNNIFECNSDQNAEWELRKPFKGGAVR